MNLQRLVLVFISLLRIGNFQLYVESLTKLVSWFFAMNHVNHARWIPINIRDMCSISSLHPHILREFSDGKFVIHKTARPFSAIGIDHAHEQANAYVKGDGGAIGIMDDPSAL